MKDIQKKVYAESCDVVHIPHFPCVLSETDLERMGVLASEGITIGERNRQLETQYNSLRQLKPRVTDNFESLNKELSETESAILSFEEIVRQLIYKLSVIDEAIHRLTYVLKYYDFP